MPSPLIQLVRRVQPGVHGTCVPALPKRGRDACAVRPEPERVSRDGQAVQYDSATCAQEMTRAVGRAAAGWAAGGGGPVHRDRHAQHVYQELLCHPEEVPGGQYPQVVQQEARELSLII